MSAEFPSLADVFAEHMHQAFGACPQMLTAGPDTDDLVDRYAKAAATAWLEARTIRTVEQLDALPPGAIVLTASPRLIPSTCIWIRDTSDADGHWWNYRGDDSFTGADVLYERPEIALLLHHPDWPAPR